MKFSVGKSHLFEAVSLVAEAAEKRSPLAALEHILLETTDGGLRLSASDAHVSAVTSIACDVQKPGALALHARDLARIVGALPDGELTLDATSFAAQITSGSIKFTAHGIDKIEMPELGAFREEGAEVQARLLLDGLETVKHAACVDNSRSHLVGARFRVTGGKFTAAAVDGHRGIVYTRPTDGQDFDVFIPARAFGMVTAACSSNETVTLSQDGNSVFIAAGSTRNRYSIPVYVLSWDMVGMMDATPEHSVTVDADELSKAIKVACVAREDIGETGNKRAEPLALHFGATELGLSFRRSTITVPCAGTKKEELHLEATYLLDALRVCSGETTLHFGNPQRDYLKVTNGNVGAIIMPVMR